MLLLLLLLPLLAPLSHGCNETGWWPEVAELDVLEPAKFHAFVKPMVDMAANAYRYPRILPLSGWTLAASTNLPRLEAGAHGLAYYRDDDEHVPRRIVVVFRGTDLKSQADVCADDVIFGGFSSNMPWLKPSNCSQYSAKQLDYLSQAIEFTNKVQEAYPGSPLLLTGHSLGAALAILVSAFFSTNFPAQEIIPVVAFGTPGMGLVLERKSLKLKAESCHGVFGIEDEWDMVSRDGWKQQVGILCLYKHAEPLDCVQCSMDISTCLGCFLKTHIMKNLLDLMDNGVEFSCQKPERSQPAMM